MAEAGIPEAEWQKLDALDPATATFPARAPVGGKTIIILRTGQGYRGIERTCPHQHMTMMDALLVGNGAMIRCSQHSFTFRLSDGKGVNCPGYRLKVYEVKEEDGSLYARAVES